MLTEIYIEALLVDADQLADQVWEAWDAGKLTDGAACITWLLIAGLVSDHYGLPPDSIWTQMFNVIFFAVFGSLLLTKLITRILLASTRDRAFA